jgi:nucleoside 2-deoxyribosyltransferase
MKITLCASAKFFDKLLEIKLALESKGFEIFLPSMQDYHYLEETALLKIQKNLIRDHFKKIDQSDAIYVANYDKNDINGYVGGSVLLEMGKAFDKGIPIFFMNQVPEKISYREEILAMQPIIIGRDWNNIKETLNDNLHHKK